jgi:hypothetical protein
MVMKLFKDGLEGKKNSSAKAVMTTAMARSKVCSLNVH